MDVSAINIDDLPLNELMALKPLLDAAVAAMTASPGLSAALMMDDEAVTLVLSAEVAAE